MTTCALTFETLLAYTDHEQARWYDWFRKHTDALDVPFAEGRMATVRGLMTHIFAVELRYAGRLLGRQVTSYDDIHVTTLDEIFQLGDRARGLLKAYLRDATPEDMQTVLTFETMTAGTITASKHKIAANVFLHGIRHWGQVATAVRQGGFKEQWGHDMLLSPVQL